MSRSLNELTSDIQSAFRYPEKGCLNLDLLETILLTITEKIRLDEVKIPNDVATDKTEEKAGHQEYDVDDDHKLEKMLKKERIDSRMTAAEEDIEQHGDYIDQLFDKFREIEEKLDWDKLEEIMKFSGQIKELEEKCRLLNKRIDDSNEKRDSEIERLEGIIKEMKAEQEGVKSVIKVIQDDLYEKFAYKSQLDDLEDDLNAKLMELKSLIPPEDSLVTITQHEDLSFRVEKLEMDDSVAKLEVEVENLNNDMTEVKQFQKESEAYFQKITAIEATLDVYKKMFDEIQSNLDAINEKLSQIDPDDINDSFARLEEEIEQLKIDMEEVKLELEKCQRKVNTFSDKISNINQWIGRLEEIKVDKAALSQMLETKADLRLINQKVDKSEFSLVSGDIMDIKQNLERLTCTVKINEEETEEHFNKVDEELSLQMYKEDFILCTEPIRNRIKALIYELKRVKEIALHHLFPDAPGISKCISCNRGAHMAGPKYAGDSPTKYDENEPPDTRIRKAIDKPSQLDKDFEDTYGLSSPTTDLDSVPFPPADASRERDLLQLPVLFATARPNIGLTHEKRRSAIDKELDAYFSKKAIRPIDAGRIKPYQRAVSFATLKEEILPPVTSNSITTGGVRKEHTTKEIAQARLVQKPAKDFLSGTAFPTIASQKYLLPSKQNDNKRRKS